MQFKIVLLFMWMVLDVFGGQCENGEIYALGLRTIGPSDGGPEMEPFEHFGHQACQDLLGSTI